ncbi:hypothetical protein J2125_002955 [Erwinia toletana]|uniref:Coiled-coil protein n=1 Tax=Winslowiella toletana TaxID=92490 RepID=A0ABS4PAT8_9GAMM|nr:hypothetical protein [Winslowiella toletana]MBP2169763.1 hypothetical protein [Winslowiella toletana]
MVDSNRVSGGVPADNNNPPPTAPLASNYWDNLSLQQQHAIITALSQSGCWNLDAMELAPFIFVNANRAGNYALRIEDSEGQLVLFLPAPSQHPTDVIVICQSVNEDGLLSYAPAIQGLFIPVSAACANNSLFIALEAARCGIAPDQITDVQIIQIRRNLASYLDIDTGCENYIRHYFRHWIPREGIESIPCQGIEDSLELEQLRKAGFTITARGREVHHQLPQLRECLKLIDKILSNLFANERVNPSILQQIIAQYLGIDIADVTPAMTEPTHNALVKYHQVVESYLTTYANQFLLGEHQDRGSLAQAFPGDKHRRIILNRSLITAPFLHILQAITHELSHMMEVHGTHDIFYVLQHGLVNDISRSSEMFAAMQAENNQAFDQAGFETIILERFNPIHLSINKRRNKTPLTASDISLWEIAIASVLDKKKWAAFCERAKKEYSLSEEDLSLFESIINQAPTWQLVSQLSGVKYTNPRQLLNDIYADRTAMWRLLLQNADSFILFLFACGQEDIRHYFDTHHYENLYKNICTNSTLSLLSGVSLTPEPDYRWLERAESLTAFEFCQSLLDLAYCAVSTDTRGICDIPVPPTMPGDRSILKQFLRENAAKIVQTLSRFATATPGIMSDNNTLLFLLILNQALINKELSAKEILKIILPQDLTQDTALCNVVAESFWRNSKLIVWQQLVRRCFDQINNTDQKIYLKNFLRSAQGIAFLQQLNAQLEVIEHAPQNFIPITGTLSELLKQGIIPENYEIGLRSRKLITQQQTVSVETIELKSMLTATSHPIFSTPPYALTFKALLSGLATLRGWYIANEDAEGDTVNYFDPQGNDINQQHQMLVNNELVLVITPDRLTLNQQTPEGFQIIHSTDRPGTHSELFDAVMALQDPAPARSQQRDITTHSGLFNHLEHTDKVNKHAEEINSKISVLLRYLNEGKKTFILRKKQPSPIKRINSAGSHIKTATSDKLNEAIIGAILANIDMINEILDDIREAQAVDRKLKQLTSLSWYLQSLYSDTKNIIDRNTTLQNNELITHASQIKKDTRKSIKYTNQTRAEIYDMTGSGAYTPYQLHIQRRQNISPEPVSAGIADLILIVGEIIATTRAFSEEHNQYCAERDNQRDLICEADRAKRDKDYQQLTEELELMREQFILQLEEEQQAQLRQKQQQMPPEYVADDDGDNDNNASTQNNNQITDKPAEKSKTVAAISAEQQVSVAVPQATASGSAAGVIINSSGTDSVTVVQSSTRRIHQHSSVNRRMLHSFHATTNRGYGNVMSILDFADNNASVSDPAHNETLRISSETAARANLRPPEAKKPQPFSTLRIRSLTPEQQRIEEQRALQNRILVREIWQDINTEQLNNRVFARVTRAQQAQQVLNSKKRMQRANQRANAAESRIHKADQK